MGKRDGFYYGIPPGLPVDSYPRIKMGLEHSGYSFHTIVCIDSKLRQAIVDKIPKGSKVLVVGVGKGHIVKMLLKKGVTVVALDLSRHVLDALVYGKNAADLRRHLRLSSAQLGRPALPLTKARGVRKRNEPLLVYGDVRETVFAPDSFDYVLIEEVLVHIPYSSYRRVLTNLISYLKPGGALSIVDYRPSRSLQKRFGFAMANYRSVDAEYMFNTVDFSYIVTCLERLPAKVEWCHPLSAILGKNMWILEDGTFTAEQPKGFAVSRTDYNWMWITKSKA